MQTSAKEENMVCDHCCFGTAMSRKEGAGEPSLLIALSGGSTESSDTCTEDKLTSGLLKL